LLSRKIALPILMVLAIAGSSALAQPAIEHWQPAAGVYSDWVREMARKFEAETGIRVNVVDREAGLIMEVLTVYAAAGLAPDVVMTGSEALGEIEPLLADLDPYIDRDASFHWDIYPPSITRDRLRPSGRTVGLPTLIWAPTTARNARLFDEAGVAAPSRGWTWEEDFREVASKFTRDDDGDGLPDQYGMLLPASYSHLGIIVHHFGGSWFDNMVSPSHSRLTDPVTIEAVEFIYGELESGRMTFEGNWWGDSGAQNIAMHLTGYTSDEARSFRPEYTDTMHFEWMPPPRGAAGTGTDVALNVMVLLERSNRKDDAWRWMKYLVENPENNIGVGYAQNSPRIPANVEAFRMFFEDISRRTPSVQYLVEELVNPRSGELRIVHPEGRRIGLTITEWLRRALIERDIPVTEALIQAETVVEPVLAQFRK